MEGFFVYTGDKMAWYSSGLKFTCKLCGHCCSGEPGYVFLSKDEIEHISSYLGLAEEEFLNKYTRLIDRGTYYDISLKEREDYSCIFLSDKGCKIYPVKPLQCSTYPFWDYLLSDKALFYAEKEACPGIGEGELHSEKEIREQLDKAKKRDNYRKIKK